MADRFTIYAPTTISQQQVDDLLCAAFEGGITYWCSSADVVCINEEGALVHEFPEGAEWAHESLTRGAMILLTDSESVTEDGDGEPVIVRLTMDKFLDGIVKAAAHARQDVHTFLEDHDADSADSASHCDS